MEQELDLWKYRGWILKLKLFLSGKAEARITVLEKCPGCVSIQTTQSGGGVESEQCISRILLWAGVFSQRQPPGNGNTGADT